MASDREIEYHRSSLSPDYMDNLVPLARSEKIRKQAAEVTAIRLRDPARLRNSGSSSRNC